MFGSVPFSNLSFTVRPEAGDQVFILIAWNSVKSIGDPSSRIPPANTSAPGSLKNCATVALVLIPDGSGLSIKEVIAPPKLVEAEP